MTAPTYTKTQPGAPADFFIAEARGLERIRVTGGPPVPAVRSVAPTELVIDLIETGAPSRQAAEQFGRRLAVMHQSGGPKLGADTPGYVATIALDNSPADSWPDFYARRRLRPALDVACDAGTIAPNDAAAVIDVIDNVAMLAGPTEPPALIHGDLWAGNLLWSVDGEVWLIDAAAAGHGHRETDLAMLALFGAPFLPAILEAYDDAHPLAAGWERRVPLHQLHPLLIHATLFGGGYGSQAGAAARRALAA